MSASVIGLLNVGLQQIQHVVRHPQVMVLAVVRMPCVSLLVGIGVKQPDLVGLAGGDGRTLADDDPVHLLCFRSGLKAGLGDKGYSFLFDSPTNQQFVIVGNDKIAELDGKVTFSFWEPYDDAHHVLRFATSWATTDEDVDALLTLM